jgi:hypothetical protein
MRPWSALLGVLPLTALPRGPTPSSARRIETTKTAPTKKQIDYDELHHRDSHNETNIATMTAISSKIST